MKTAYPYLKDPRALAEIRKHQWIESQKQGEEIGFASAAVEWITKYGEVWKEIHVKDSNDRSFFLERRKYRRFPLDCTVELIKSDRIYAVEGINVGFFGLLCRSTEQVPIRCEVDIRLPLEHNSRELMSCRGIVARVLPVHVRHYEVYIRFDERSQDALSRWQYIR